MFQLLNAFFRGPVMMLERSSPHFHQLPITALHTVYPPDHQDPFAAGFEGRAIFTRSFSESENPGIKAVGRNVSSGNDIGFLC